MSSALNNINSTLTAFFSWWGTELAGLLPRAFARGSQSALPNRLISIEDGGLRVVGPNGAASDELLTTAEAVDKLSREKGRASLRVGLRLPYRACFSRRVELPSGAARDFPRLLALDLERATPFKPRDIRSAHFIEDEQRTPGKTAIRQLIVKRVSIDGIVSSLHEAGLTVARIDCWGPDGQTAMPVNFLEAATDASTRRRGWFWPVALTASAAAIAAFGGNMLLERHDGALADLKAENTRLLKVIKAHRDADAIYQAQQAEVRSFAQVLASAPSKAMAIEELTRLLPDNARVTDLKLEGNTVDISGIAQSAIGLVPILERSTYFVDATSTAPVMFDQREGKERFSIRVRIRNSNAGGAP
jgi:general secretion pathway protein L